VESGTPLERRRDLLPANTDDLWLAGREALEKAGYEQYEVSNFAPPHKRCVHNIRYWRMEGWLGAGPAASGTLIHETSGTAVRHTFPADLDSYLKAPCIHSALCEELDRGTLLRESLLMGYRYCEGPDLKRFRQRFGCSVEDCIPKTLARWKGREIMLFLNSFLLEAFTELG
jgi:oxygen-independent coproporphyrinogen-3 oxidase